MEGVPFVLVQAVTWHWHPVTGPTCVPQLAGQAEQAETDSWKQECDGMLTFPQLSILRQTLKQVPRGLKWEADKITGKDRDCLMIQS